MKPPEYAPGTRQGAAATASPPPRSRRRPFTRYLPAKVLQTPLALVDQVAVSGTRFFTAVVLGRMALDNELALYSLGFSVLLFVQGVQHSLIAAPYTVFGNRISGPERSQYAGSMLVHLLALATLSTAFLLLALIPVALGIGPEGLGSVLGMVMAIIPLLLLKEFGRSLAFAHLRVGVAVFLDVVMSSVQIAGILCLATFWHLSAVTAYAMVGLGCGVAGLLWLLTTWRTFLVRKKRLLPDFKQNWKFGRWIFASQITAIAHVYGMYWLITLTLSVSATDAFAECMAVVSLANPLLLGIANILGPQAARSFAADGRSGVRRVITNALFLFLFLLGPFCLVLFLKGGEMIRWLFASQHVGQEFTLLLLGLTILVGALSVAFENGLRAMERTAVVFTTALSGLCVTLVATLALVGPFQLTGAAAGLFIGIVLTAALRGVAFLRNSRQSEPHRDEERRSPVRRAMKATER